jgi:hypothetical protein
MCLVDPFEKREPNPCTVAALDDSHVNHVHVEPGDYNVPITMRGIGRVIVRNPNGVTQDVTPESARLGCGVLLDGTVTIGGPSVTGETTVIATDIDIWRETNRKIEELARLAGL